MFRKLSNARHRRKSLEMMLGFFDRTLWHGQSMYEQVSGASWRRRSWDGVRDAVLTQDREINDLVRDIRREVVRHLTRHSARDVVVCLLLMSIVKDAERIGDYCKNMVDVGQALDGGRGRPPGEMPLEDIGDLIIPLFERVRCAFREDDREAGREAFVLAEDVGRRCECLIESLLRQGSSMEPGEAVACGLMSRYLKRIAAHLGNIASGSAATLENLDFGDEAHRTGDEKT